MTGLGCSCLVRMARDYFPISFQTPDEFSSGVWCRQWWRLGAGLGDYFWQWCMTISGVRVVVRKTRIYDVCLRVQIGEAIRD